MPRRSDILIALGVTVLGAFGLLTEDISKSAGSRASGMRWASRARWP